MKNITINLIGQSVLEEVLHENLQFINFTIHSFKKFDEIINNSSIKNSDIIITNLKDHDLFIKSRLNLPALFLNFGSKNNNIPANLKLCRLMLVILLKRFKISSVLIPIFCKINFSIGGL